MAENFYKETNIFIPAETIQKWRDRRRQLRDRLLETQQELEAIENKLHAVYVLGEEPKKVEQRALFPSKEPEPTPEADKSIPDAVLTILRDSKKPLRPFEIRKELAGRGYPAKRLKNYLYTVLLRLSDRNKIQKLKNGYTLVSDNNNEAPDDMMSPGAS